MLRIAPEWRVRRSALRNDEKRGTAPSIILQYLEHAAGHHNTTLVGGYLGGHENQAAGRADDARPGDQDIADLAAVDKMGVELDRRQCRPARYVSCRHAAAAIRECHQ